MDAEINVKLGMTLYECWRRVSFSTGAFTNDPCPWDGLSLMQKKRWEDIAVEFDRRMAEELPVMSFTDYEGVALPMAFYDHSQYSVIYPTIGLVGEAGEVADKVKKIIRDEGGVETLSEKSRIDILKEMGDVLWYLAALAQDLGSHLSEVAEMNIKKLKKRTIAGTLGGSGDDR